MLQDTCQWLQAVLLRDEVHKGLASEYQPEVQEAEQRLQLLGQPQRLVLDHLEETRVPHAETHSPAQAHKDGGCWSQFLCPIPGIQLRVQCFR